ncbi:MAG: aspartate aminotransferase family protein [Tetrasphaera sp.]|nr:aspartate aminotransferase family protein [Tetrasphaera sp.]
MRGKIRERLRSLQSLDLPTGDGRTMAYVYDSGLPESEQVGREALALYATTNGLDPTGFPSLLIMENDLISTCAGLLHAPEGAAGAATSGGTESIILAVLAAREGAPRVDRPSIVVASSAHAAFHKAGKLLGVEVRVVPTDPVSRRAVPSAMAAACDSSTVLISGSAPSFGFGVIDPIADIAAIAAERGIRCHVDACIGGYVLPFLDDIPEWDFRLPGVTSISVDLHKYGYTPKGISVLIHRDAELRKGHYFAWSDWPGYTLINPTLLSTRSGAPVAAAWAVTHHIGEDGYRELARSTRAATLELALRIEGIDGLRVSAPPDSTLVAMETDGSCDVFTICDEMLERGWFIQPQMSHDSGPPTAHLTLSAATVAHLDAVTSALEECVAAARAAGPIVPDPMLVSALDALGSIDASQLDSSAIQAILGLAGLAGEDGSIRLPDRMAPVNALLDLIPPAVRDPILVEVYGLLATAQPLGVEVRHAGADFSD